MSINKIIGKESLIRVDTGEVVEMDVILQKQSDTLNKRGWRRTNIKELMEILALVGNRKIQVLNLLIQKMNGANKVEITQREVAKILNIDLSTVSAAFTELSGQDIIKKIKNNYIINTTIISCFGDVKNNGILTKEYGFEYKNKEKDKIKSEQIRVIQISKKLKEIEKLKADIEQLNNKNFVCNKIAKTKNIEEIEI
ncbi:hypothetical protein FE246_03675 [Aliarcobacter thereius]|uniref:Plasmid replication protein RepL domain-containing protein n=1 Tax=Aliarcobacter thereius TaxID=544718 RepID=A0A5R9HCQ0_9BACT|nr:replication/maintenance protein RepL [Aliarcobacter thereius]TLS72499.1 hypothetical protein FE246_03675 [Aliarcobacter thereius]